MHPGSSQGIQAMAQTLTQNQKALVAEVSALQLPVSAIDQKQISWTGCHSCPPLWP